jgi:hypothetical protein
MWELIEWPPRSPKCAWIFVGMVFISAVLGLVFLFCL